MSLRPFESQWSRPDLVSMQRLRESKHVVKHKTDRNHRQSIRIYISHPLPFSRLPLYSVTLRIILFKIKPFTYLLSRYFTNRKYALHSNHPVYPGFCHCRSCPIDPRGANREFFLFHNDVYVVLVVILANIVPQKATLYNQANYLGDYFNVGKVGQCVEIPDYL